MSPSETSQREDYLEPPEEAFAYYLNRGCAQAVRQQKHMGSRVVAVLCRDEATARRRFGVTDGTIGNALKKPPFCAVLSIEVSSR